ncbi:M16 family metallopeptidase [Poseidonibacter antarcticus]|uniref:M16 family metallopeptidase n=1 Tax=Poseidonibacter antarcticus TaxID=2478538 RepID=UPI000EF545A9|nr:insulinase family protein [Poseidonibacter antarcticus]
MNTNKTFKTVEKNGKKYNFLALPGTGFFKFELINLYGSNIERVIENKTAKNIYGISHFIEHLSFKSPVDFTSDELMNIGRNEGVFNASTNHDRINYWFKTTASNIDTAINFVCNVAQNDLTKISQDEFNIEKDVVYNEAKRGQDNFQQMFYRDVKTKLLDYHIEDNVIGIPETIDTFTLQDAIDIKNIFLSHENIMYNITYDNTIIDENQIIEKIEKELARFKVSSKQTYKVSHKEYQEHLKLPTNKTLKVQNNSKQAMTSIVMDGVENTLVMSATLNYLSQLATDTSLNDIIRIKNGLTYGIQFRTQIISYKPYITFACDVTRGNENKLLELFKESINLSANNFSKDKYDKYMKTMSLKRTIGNLNLASYEIWFGFNYIQAKDLDPVRQILENNIDDGYKFVHSKIISYVQMYDAIQNIKQLVNNDKFAKVYN